MYQLADLVASAGRHIFAVGFSAADLHRFRFLQGVDKSVHHPCVHILDQAVADQRHHIVADQAGVGCINGQAPLFRSIDFYKLSEKILHRNV